MHRPSLKENEENAIRLFREAISDLVELRDSVMMLSDDVERFSLVQVNCTKGKHYLMDKASEAIKYLTAEVAAEARALLRQGLKTYSEILANLKEPPAKVDELSAKREYVFALEGQISRVENTRVIPSLQRIELLHQFEGSIPQKDLALSMNIRLWPQKLRKAAEIASEMMAKRQKVFERELFKEQSSEFEDDDDDLGWRGLIACSPSTV